MKKCLVIRLGAIGDMLIITPAIKRLKEMGYYVILNTNKRGREVFANNPNVDEYIDHDESMPLDQLDKHWEKLKEDIKPDKFINFSESIECNAVAHPIQPAYNYTKPERVALFNVNYYDATEKWAGLEGCQKLPELYFTPFELEEAQKYLKFAKFNILWHLSGSGKQKVYPWADYVIAEILKDNEDLCIITTGDEKCQLLESITDERITNLSGRIPVRIAMCLTKFVDLVVAPDTGVLHAAGCFATPKLGLLGHTTRTNITQYFHNDYSIEADCACAPCMRLIYDHDLQCPIDVVTRAAWCMAVGIPPEKLYARIKEALGHIKAAARREDTAAALSDMRS